MLQLRLVCIYTHARARAHTHTHTHTTHTHTHMHYHVHLHTHCTSHIQILEAAIKAAPNAKIVAVMINGGTIAIDWIKDHADSILNAW
jgi:stalled ribosome rescue protein Dom34